MAMKRALIVLLTLATITGLIYMPGCSDDEGDGAGPITKAEGDTLDPLFIQAMTVFDYVDDQVGEGFGGAFDLVSGFLNMRRQVFEWHSDSKFWYHQELGSEGGWSWIGKDSIQFLEGGIPQQEPDSALLDQVKVGFYYLETFEALKPRVNPNVLDTAILRQFFVNVAGQPGEIAGRGDVTASGNAYLSTSSEYIYKKIPACNFELDMTATISNLSLNIANVMLYGCPTSGSVSYSGTVTLECTGDIAFTNTDNWTMTETFSVESISYVVENSTHRWAWTEPCLNK
jgi:hypothetical protein